MLLEASTARGTGSRTSSPTRTSGTRCTKPVAQWTAIGADLPRNPPHFAWSQAKTTGEDHATAYLQQAAAEAGLDTVGLAIEQIGWDSALDRFVDLEEAPTAAS